MEPHETERVHNGQRWVQRIVAHPRAVTAVIVGVLVVLAVPMTGLKLALPNDGTSEPSTTQRQAYDMVAEGYGPGFNGPLVVVADGRGIEDTGDRLRTFDTLVDDFAQIEGVAIAQIGAGGLNEARDTAKITIIPSTAPSDEATPETGPDAAGHGTAGRRDHRHLLWGGDRTDRDRTRHLRAVVRLADPPTCWWWSGWRSSC